MAGDWIKVEQATLHKAEVLRMAELLGISRRECIGLLLDFWAWLDNNARTEVVPNLSRLCLDSVLNCPGISAALEVVGWIVWDDKAASARITNYDHHNGASAKTRAYEQKRKQEQRRNLSQDCPAKTGTREEKRRVLDTSLRSVSKRATLNSPSEEHEAIAADRGLSCQTEFQKYRDWQASTGKRHKDEVAGFRNWLRNAKPPDRSARQASNMDILTGRAHAPAKRMGDAVVLALPSDLRESGADDVEGRGPERGALRVG